MLLWALIKAVFRRHNCITCGGRGYLIYVPAHPSQGRERKQVTCDDCIGTGIDYVRSS